MGGRSCRCRALPADACRHPGRAGVRPHHAAGGGAGGAEPHPGARARRRLAAHACPGGLTDCPGVDDPRARQLIRYGGAFFDEPIVRASGSFVETASGRRVLDFTAGQICATIGPNQPRGVAEIRRALDDVIHLNSWMLSPPVIELASALIATLPPSLAKAIFVSTGGEAIEIAVRMAKLYTGQFEVLSLTRSWHGLTGGAAALTLSGGRRGYGPAMPGSFALHVPYAYRCPTKHCQKENACDGTCLEAGFELFDQASVGAPAAVVVVPGLSAGGVVGP